MSENITLLISLASLGLFGGFSHCAGMCGPFVVSQVGSRLEKTSLDGFSNFERLKNLALLPYHFGRITTYCFLGFLCSFLLQNIQDIESFNFIPALFLLLGSIGFFILFLKKSNFEIKSLKKLSIFLAHKFSYIYIFSKLLPFGKKKKSQNKLLSALFKSPKGFKGYLLGVILGFIPCSLLYSAFIIVSIISQPILAVFGMFLFGIATFPSLFLTACGGYVFFRIDSKYFTLISRVVFLINSLTLFLMAFKLIN